MPPLAQQARAVARGEKNPHVGFTDPIENRAWAVWYAVRNGKVKTAGVPANGPSDRGLGNVSGWTVEINMTTKMRDTWSQISQLDVQSRNNFISEVRQFLTRSGNAVCTRLPGIGTGDHGQPEWWVRDEWNDVKGIPLFRATELTSTEKRLSPAEAGEDRSPAPVAIRNRDEQATLAELEDATSTTEQPASLKSALERVAIQVEEDKTVIANALADAKMPLYQREVTEAVGFTHEKTGRLLRAMISDGDKRVHRRVETSEERPEGQNGRYHLLYWHSPEIPLRDVKTYRVTEPFMRRIEGLKAGQRVATKQMSGGIRSQVDELISAGILELVGAGTDDEHVRLAPDQDGVESVEEAIEETAATPATIKVGPRPLPRPDRNERTPAADELTAAGKRYDSNVGEIAAMVEAMVQQRVIERMKTLAAKAEADSKIVAEYKERAERAESALIAARAELSEVNGRLAKAKALFG